MSIHFTRYACIKHYLSQTNLSQVEWLAVQADRVGIQHRFFNFNMTHKDIAVRCKPQQSHKATKSSHWNYTGKVPKCSAAFKTSAEHGQRERVFVNNAVKVVHSKMFLAATGTDCTIRLHRYVAVSSESSKLTSILSARQKKEYYQKY